MTPYVQVQRDVLIDIIRIASANDKLVKDEYEALDALADALEAGEKHIVSEDDWEVPQK